MTGLRSSLDMSVEEEEGIKNNPQVWAAEWMLISSMEMWKTHGKKVGGLRIGGLIFRCRSSEMLLRHPIGDIKQLLNMESEVQRCVHYWHTFGGYQHIQCTWNIYMDTHNTVYTYSVDVKYSGYRSKHILPKVKFAIFGILGHTRFRFHSRMGFSS